MIPVPYIKAHTNKNDFLFIPISMIKLVKDHIPHITSSHNGIYADGVVFYEREDEEFVVKYYNKDGSHALICGNSLISIGGLYEFIKHERETLSVKTESGERSVIPFEDGSWGALVAPLEDKIRKVQIVIEDRVYTGFYTEAPRNPHFIIEEKPEDALFTYLSPKIARHREFDKGTNVEFIYEENGKLHVRVYERGVGETMACATGASAIYLLYKFVKLQKLNEVYFKGGKYSFFEKNDFVGLKAYPKIISRGILFI